MAIERESNIPEIRNVEFVELVVQGSDPSTPTSGLQRFYAKSGGVFSIDSSAAVFGPFAAGGGSSPLTTKGDIYVYSTLDDRLPVGTNGQILSANSATATGLEWVAAGASGANTALSNLAATAVNADIIPGADNTINLGSSAFNYAQINTKLIRSSTSISVRGTTTGSFGSLSSTTGATGTASFSTGAVSVTAAASGAVSLFSGSVSTTTGASGSASVISGDTVNSNTGSANIFTGTPTGSGNSGAINLTTGEPQGAGNSGAIHLTTSDPQGAGVSGVIDFQTGNPASGASGGITLGTGASSVTSGSITLGTGAGTPRGKIIFSDGSEGTSGHYWRSTDAAGSGNWAAGATGTVTSVSATVPAFLSVAGSPITTSGTLAITLSGTALPIANGGTGQTAQTAAFDALAPNTTKGDLIAYDGTDNVRLAVGTNGFFLKANSATATGLEWAAASGSSPLTTKGDIYVYSTLDTRLPVGTNGFVLSANSATATGLEWVATGGASANPFLSNLTSPTAVSEDLIFATGSPATLQTQNEAAAVTEDLTVKSGNAGGAGNFSGDAIFQSGNSADDVTGNVIVKSGNPATANFDSGVVNLQSGNASGTGLSGEVALISGNTVNGTSGNVYLLSGDTSGTAGSGQANLSTGATSATGSNTGGINIISGDPAANGDSGFVLVKSGAVTGTGDAGLITIDGGSSVDGAAGSITISPGAESGTGTPGDLNITLPTDGDALVTGAGTSEFNMGSIPITNMLTQTVATTAIDLYATDVQWHRARSGFIQKIQVDYTAFTAAGLTQDLELFSLPAGAMVKRIVMKHSTAFAATGLTSLTMSIGITGNLTKYASVFSVSQATSNTTFQVSDNATIETFGAATSVRVSAIAVGANLNTLTAGSFDVWLEYQEIIGAANATPDFTLV